MGCNTNLVRIGVATDPTTGAVCTPIYQCATFAHPALGESTGFDYSRTANPTRQVLEQAIAKLEGGAGGFAFATGMAAVTAVLMLFKPGDHLVVTEDLYGGTYRVLDKIFGQYGIAVTYVDTADTLAVQGALQPNTKGIFVETPTNPMLKVADIAAITSLVQGTDILTIIDNTFMTPCLQKPLELGADLVVHSATKYLGGHNDLLAGLVVAKTPELAERVGFFQNATGAILGPFDCWLLIRGLKTLGLRLERQQANALALASWLDQHPKVQAVYYPGLESHCGHQVQKEQAKGFGGMLSFAVANPALAGQVLGKVKVISFAESLGGVESLITYPAVQTHADIPAEERERLGIGDTLLRLSVGVEDVEDLIEDLAQALE